MSNEILWRHNLSDAQRRMSIQSPVSMQDILTARTRIRDFVRHTPLERSVELSRRLSGDVYLKMENLQFARLKVTPHSGDKTNDEWA